jgi:hypothetical protein
MILKDYLLRFATKKEHIIDRCAPFQAVLREAALKPGSV